MGQQSSRNVTYDPVIVMGAPRGGTSLVAGCLDVLGVDMGQTRGTDHQNPTGYFEDREFLKLSSELFKAADPSSHGFQPSDQDEILAEKENFGPRIKNLLEKRALETDAERWGWKVPTMALTIPLFWQQLDEPSIVIVYRNPLDVARSSVRYTRAKDLYEEISLEQGLNVTLFYYRLIGEFLQTNQDIAPLLLSYEDVVKHPEKEVRKMADFLGTTLERAQLQKIKERVKTRRGMAFHKTIQRCKEIVLDKWEQVKSVFGFW